MDKHKCQDCKFYQAEISCKKTGAYCQSFCHYVELNEYNHQVDVIGQFSWNKNGECEKFTQKEQ